MKKKDIKKIIKIQRNWKNILAFRNDIVKELKLFRKITEKIMINLELSYKNEIFSLSDYKKSIELLQYAYELLSNYPEQLTVKYMNKFSKFKILSNLARMKLSLIEIITLVGQCSINDTIRLFGCNLTEVSCYTNVFKLYLEYLKDYFKIIKVEYYNSENENNLSFKINT